MRLFALSLIAFIAFSSAAAGTNPYAGKKLIEYGWDVPDTAFVRAHVAEMEKVPFDGVVIRVLGKPGGGQLGWRVFSKQRITPDEYQQAIADLKATKFRRFTDNFIQVIAYPGDVDWFDPDWSATASNAESLARVAKLTGCRGIMFDPEHYNSNPLCHIWDYKSFAPDKRAAHSFEQYAAKVKERGREFMRAIGKEYPGIAILTLYGHSLPYMQSKPGGLARADYGLMAAFYDGMCEAAGPGTTITDGFESSYGFRDRKSFQEARKLILGEARSISTSPQAFTKHIRAGFGIWADNGGARIGWHPDDFSRNYFMPAELRASLSYALELSDRYVWVYSERLVWWHFNVPAPYVNALAQAKTGPGPGGTNSNRFDETPRASEQQDYSDEPTFAQFRKTMTDIYSLPKDGWRFKLDQANSGRKAGWTRADFDDSSWRTISIGKFWDEQGVTHVGRAWYRVKFTAPEIEAGKRVFLAVGAADESAWVWLNGKPIGAHDIGPSGWDVPFALDVTRDLRPGEENVLAVQVYNRGFAGGLWKSIKLMIK